MKQKEKLTLDVKLIFPMKVWEIATWNILPPSNWATVLVNL